MCNAWNHSSDCRCGFGPHYAVWGKSIFGKKEDWSTKVLKSQTQLRKGLEEIGFDKKTIDESVLEYRDATRKNQNLRPWLKKLLGRYEYEVARSRVRLIKVPIFKLHLPKEINGKNVLGSRITYAEEIEIGQRVNWSFKVFGIGMGNTHHVRMQCNAEATAEKGQCKLVYISVPVRVSKVAVIERNRPITYIPRVEVAPIVHSTNFHIGTSNCPKKACKEDRLYIGPPSDFYPLVDDPIEPPNPRGIKWTYRRSRKIEIKFKAFGMEIILPINIYRRRELSLQFELPGGHNYALIPLKNNTGIKWKLDWKFDSQEPPPIHPNP